MQLVKHPQPSVKGSRILNRVPTPSLLSTSIVPLCASAICLHILNPSPLPPSSESAPYQLCKIY